MIRHCANGRLEFSDNGAVRDIGVVNRFKVFLVEPVFLLANLCAIYHGSQKNTREVCVLSLIHI